MQASFEQLMFIENMEKNFGIKFVDYGFHSDGSIGVTYTDEFGLACVTVYRNGTTEKN